MLRVAPVRPATRRQPASGLLYRLKPSMRTRSSSVHDHAEFLHIRSCGRRLTRQQQVQHRNQRRRLPVMSLTGEAKVRATSWGDTNMYVYVTSLHMHVPAYI